MNRFHVTVAEPQGYDGKIVAVTTELHATKCLRIAYEFQTFGAGIRKISVFDGNHTEHTLTLTYDSLSESCSNPSLAGLTIGPNAGRLPGETDLELTDQADTLHVHLIANEGDKQLHGGLHHLATVHWTLEDVIEQEDSCDVIFTTTQPAGLDSWPGNRNYRVTYHIDEGGLTMHLEANTDALTYLNLTNHTYWMREGLDCEVATTDGLLAIKKDAVLNNAFLLDSMKFAARLHWPALDLSMELTTDAPAMVIYTGDYLDNASPSTPACAVALEAQEYWSLSDIRLARPDETYHREIRYTFA